LARVDAPLVIVGEKASPDEPQPLELPCVVSGRLERRRQIHAFQFSAAKGQRLNFRVESAVLGYPLDALLSVVDATGKVVSEVDDTGGSSDALVAFTAPADGQYKLLLRDLHDRGGFRFAYRLTCGPPRPDFALTVAAGEFVLAAGKTLEIPVTIDRRDGFKEEIAVSVEGLPEGVSVEEQTSAATGATAKTVKLTLKAAESVPASSLSIRVVGRSGETPRAATFSLAGLTGQAHSGVWLTVTGK
jgi:hypothetical protein